MKVLELIERLQKIEDEHPGLEAMWIYDGYIQDLDQHGEWQQELPFVREHTKEDRLVCVVADS